ncbi:MULTISPECIES: hypothetical protein [Pseudomonas]|uniref:Uncharacterized protein n=1 Tax=Pseudomonas piscis TaxID=2614538 RepID=U6ZUR5_9PSED|nr:MULTISPECIES: hypothetical protein [Pseudomonas]AZC16717.1 hypothetical protein C4K40_1305 [Pseudomonas sp. CMR5c]ERO62021.1 hypothetical protein P308_06390 [Pseudomonas piscis]MBC2655183.1 hypothetical protein [Pseudomonas sp. MSSRFD41]MCU7649525.1 hypothetical protein [Pseudomonas piscis]MQA52633.1 hypothetical protein [Pseudomonas piscis]
MAEKYISVTAVNGQAALVSVGSVSKVIDQGNYRVIYQGSDTNNYQVTNTLASLKVALNAV